MNSDPNPLQSPLNNDIPEEFQTPLRTPVAYPLSNPSEKLKGPQLLLFFLVIIVLFLVTFGTVYLAQSYISARHTGVLPTPTIPLSPSPIPQSSTLPEPTRIPSPSPHPTIRPSSAPTPTKPPVLDVSFGQVDFSDTIPPFIISYPATANPITLDEQRAAPYLSLSFEVKNNSSVPLSQVKYLVKLNGSALSLGEGSVSTVPAQDSVKMTLGRSLPIEPQTYTVTIELNPQKDFVESHYDNNTYSFSYTVRPDTQPPAVTIDVLRKSETHETCVSLWLTDNVTNENEVQLQGKLDSESWYSFPLRADPSKEQRYERCLSGSPGDPHTFSVKATDKRGNTTEVSKNFSLLSF